MNLTNVGSAAGVVHPACRTSGHDDNGYREHNGVYGPGPHKRVPVNDIVMFSPDLLVLLG
jgi:hypothetical protein